jgi:hypothetical protein
LRLDPASPLVLELAFPEKRPKTVAELRLARFWIQQLAQVYFKFGSNYNPAVRVPHASGVLFNPALVEMLFPRQGLRLSFTDLYLQLTHGHELPSLAPSINIGYSLNIDIGSYGLEELLRFFHVCKHNVGASCFREARINSAVFPIAELAMVFFVVYSLSFE